MIQQNLLPIVSLVNGGGVGITQVAGTATLSAGGGPGGAADGWNPIAAGSQTAGSTGSVVFANSNGIVFGMSGSSRITASHDGLTSQSNQNVTASNGGFAFQTLSFSNANGISFGTSAGSAIIASYTVPTVPPVTNSSWTVSDSATSGSVGRLAFTNLNGVTLSLSSGTGGLHTIVGSHNGLTTARASNDAVGLNTAQTNVVWTVNSSGISLNAGGYAGTSTGATNASVTLNTAGIAISVAAPGGGAAPGASAANGSFSFNTLSFSNLNGISFGTSAGSAITASHNGLTTARASNDAVGLNTAQTNVTWTVNSSGLSLNAAGYAGTTTGATNASVTLNSNGLAISVAAPGGGAAVTKSVWNPAVGILVGQSTTVAPLGNGSVQVFPVLSAGAAIISRVDAFASVSVSTSSNSSHAGAISLHVGIYTRNGSTLSLATSGSQSYQWSNTSNNSTSVLAGLKRLSIPVAATISDGEYWVAFLSRTSTTNANWVTLNNGVQSAGQSAQLAGLLGSSSNGTYQLMPGQGIWSTTSTALPGSIAFSHISGGRASSQDRFIPTLVGYNYTV